MWFFYYFERSYDVLKSKSPCILLIKNINLNETELKMENPTHSFRGQTLVCLNSYKNRKLKVKSRKKKEGIFLYRLLCVLSHCIVY